MLLQKIGVGVEVHHLEEDLIKEAIEELKQWQHNKQLAASA
jgi:hypothetical protein